MKVRNRKNIDIKERISIISSDGPVTFLIRRKKRDARSSRVIEEILGTFLVALETADHV